MKAAVDAITPPAVSQSYPSQSIKLIAQEIMLVHILGYNHMF